MSSGQFEMIPLPFGITTIGRSRQSSVVLSSPVVSKHHAAIECTESACRLKNESSKGTTVNGQKVLDVVSLQHGDQIQIGLEVLFFLRSDAASVKSDSGRLKVSKIASDSSEESIRHLLGNAGKIIPHEATFSDVTEKICARISLCERSIASLSTTDSVRKLSQVLRLIEVVRDCPFSNRTRAIFDALYQFFPQTMQIVIAEVVAGRASEFRISATDVRDEQQSALVCEGVIQHAARNNECLLLADQWREAPQQKPKLSTMGRISMMCVPTGRGEHELWGVVQLIGGVNGPEFDMGDLERLAILAQLLTIVLPLRSFP